MYGFVKIQCILDFSACVMCICKPMHASYKSPFHLTTFPLPHAASAQVHISSPMSGGRACYKDQFEVTCWYPEVTTPGRYLVPSPGWRVNGSVITPDGTTYRKKMINDTATKLTVTVTDAFSVNTIEAYSCFLKLADYQFDESRQQVHIHIMG